MTGIIILSALALIAVYIVGWRHGFDCADHPHRSKSDRE